MTPTLCIWEDRTVVKTTINRIKIVKPNINTNKYKLEINYKKK